MKINKNISKIMEDAGFKDIAKTGEELKVKAMDLYNAVKEGEIQPYYYKVDEEGYGVGKVWLLPGEIAEWKSKKEAEFLASIRPTAGKYRPIVRKRKEKAVA